MTAAIGTSLCTTTIDMSAPRLRRSGMVIELSKRIVTFLVGITLGCGLISVAQDSGPDISSPIGQIEILIRRNRLDEAKPKTLEELHPTPTTVDAYTLL